MKILLAFIIIVALFFSSPNTNTITQLPGDIYIYTDEGKGTNLGSCIETPYLGDTSQARGICIKNVPLTSQQIVDKLKIKVCKIQKLGNIDCIYGYSKSLGNGVRIDGKLINVQIATNNGVVTVGSPLIIGSY